MPNGGLFHMGFTLPDRFTPDLADAVYFDIFLRLAGGAKLINPTGYPYASNPLISPEEYRRFSIDFPGNSSISDSESTLGDVITVMHPDEKTHDDSMVACGLEEIVFCFPDRLSSVQLGVAYAELQGNLGLLSVVNPIWSSPDFNTSNTPEEYRNFSVTFSPTETLGSIRQTLRRTLAFIEQNRVA